MRQEAMDDELLGHANRSRRWTFRHRKLPNIPQRIQHPCNKLRQCKSWSRYEDNWNHRFHNMLWNMTTAYTEVFSPSRNALWKLYGNFQKYSAHPNFSRAKGSRDHTFFRTLPSARLRKYFWHKHPCNVSQHENPDDFIRCLRQLEKVLLEYIMSTENEQTMVSDSGQVLPNKFTIGAVHNQRLWPLSTQCVTSA